MGNSSQAPFMLLFSTTLSSGPLVLLPRLEKCQILRQSGLEVQSQILGPKPRLTSTQPPGTPFPHHFITPLGSSALPMG